MPITTPTIDSVRKELIQTTYQYYQQLWCGIDCNKEELERKMTRLYDYLWLLMNNSCNTEAEVLCVIKTKT